MIEKNTMNKIALDVTCEVCYAWHDVFIFWTGYPGENERFDLNMWLMCESFSQYLQAQSKSWYQIEVS
jgi:hypothetical protein